MPLRAFLRILIWSLKLSQILGRNWYQAKAFIFRWKNLILARKCLANGIIDAVWFSLPISVSKLLAFVLSFDKMSWIVFVQDMDLGSGKLTHNACVLYKHPKATLISYNVPLAFDFDGLIISSLGTGSFWANGRETARIASGIDAFPLDLLLPISGTTVMKLSRYMSILPWGSTSMLTAKGLLWANGMEMYWVDGGGIEFCFGAWVYRG